LLALRCLFSTLCLYKERKRKRMVNAYSRRYIFVILTCFGFVTSLDNVNITPSDTSENTSDSINTLFPSVNNDPSEEGTSSGNVYKYVRSFRIFTNKKKKKKSP